MRPLIPISVLAFSILLGNCRTGKRDTEIQDTALKGDDIVLALVNDSPITQYDLDQAIESTLGKANKEKLRETGRKNMLESLIRSRAVAQAQEQELSETERATLDKKVKEYREKLLVKQYLAEHTQPESISKQMVEEYYRKNPEKFGGKTIRMYEMIASRRSLVTQEKKKVIQALENAESNQDWNQLATSLNVRGLPILYKKGQVREKLYERDLQQLIESVKTGQTSSLSFIKGRAYLVRITEEKRQQPRPLSDVSADIHKSLKPIQLKEAVKEASEQVMKNARIEYK